MDLGLLPNGVGDKWSTEKIIHFLEEYKNHPCLWDSRHRQYKSKNDRIGAEVEILRKMKLQSMDLNVFRIKVRNIRNTYRQEVMKILKNSKPDAGADGVFVPKLRWFGLADSFLRKTLELGDIPTIHLPSPEAAPSRLSSDLLPVLLPFQRSQESEEVSLEPALPIDEPSVLEFEDIKPNVEDLRQLETSRSTPKRSRPWDPPARVDDKTDPPVAVDPLPPTSLSETKAPGAAVAEFDSFGRYLSAQLQQLPMDVAVELEMEIVNLVCRKRLFLLREDSELVGMCGDPLY
ncbi:uncharacterized protein [Hetaerina americana]|uniref:uncharacterized protein isoform X1 n=1 Tax=Hetaerina americana TaxID=62018 RepID=UPI003A7F4EDD